MTGVQTCALPISALISSQGWQEKESCHALRSACVCVCLARANAFPSILFYIDELVRTSIVTRSFFSFEASRQNTSRHPLRLLHRSNLNSISGCCLQLDGTMKKKVSVLFLALMPIRARITARTRALAVREQSSHRKSHRPICSSMTSYSTHLFVI